MSSPKNVPNEYSRSIHAVMNFIQSNLNENLSLEKLSSVANYSPFHFQKIFKQVTGESPKQYIVRMRLEAAAHSLIIQLEKPIKEIALDSGFSSPATFARAFKNYFGISAESLRMIPVNERMELYKNGKHNKLLLDTDLHFKGAGPETSEEMEPLHVVVKKIKAIFGIFTSCRLEDVANIEMAFRKVLQLADAHDLSQASSKPIGIIYPHHLSYKAMISLDPLPQLTNRFHTIDIAAGKYGTFKLKGDLKKTFRSLKIFVQQWLPENGYKLADIFGFEILSEDPRSNKYGLIEREMYIPIIPE